MFLLAKHLFKDKLFALLRVVFFFSWNVIQYTAIQIRPDLLLNLLLLIGLYLLLRFEGKLIAILAGLCFGLALACSIKSLVFCGGVFFFSTAFNLYMPEYHQLHGINSYWNLYQHFMVRDLGLTCISLVGFFGVFNKSRNLCLILTLILASSFFVIRGLAPYYTLSLLSLLSLTDVYSLKDFVLKDLLAEWKKIPFVFNCIDSIAFVFSGDQSCAD